MPPKRKTTKKKKAVSGANEGGNESPSTSTATFESDETPGAKRSKVLAMA